MAAANAEVVAFGGKPVRFFDAHCDTVMKVLDEGADFITGCGTTHVSLPGMQAAGISVQVFACFVLSERYPGREAERADEMLAALDGMVGETSGAMQVVRTRAELEANDASGGISAILGLEGADPLEAKADNLRRYAEVGVRDLIFAWQDNPFSGTAFGTNTSLTAEGERLLGLAEELGVMVDVSHLSDLAFDDVCRTATRPFVASHSNCRALCASPRNLTDPMIRSLADRGGVMGINLSPGFLDQDWWDLFAESRREHLSDAERERITKARNALPRPPLARAVRHILHTINVGGEDCIGIGGDLDGISVTPEGIDTVADYPKLIPFLADAGLTERRIEKVCYRNFLRVFNEVLPR